MFGSVNLTDPWILQIAFCKDAFRSLLGCRGYVGKLRGLKSYFRQRRLRSELLRILRRRSQIHAEVVVRNDAL